MHRPPKRRRKHLRNKSTPAPIELSRRDRWFLLSGAILVVVGASASLHFVGEWHARREREVWLATLETRYGATETQRSHIREIEISYHGTGSIFKLPGHTPAELATHRQLISEQIPADALHRFLADQAGHDSLSATP